MSKGRPSSPLAGSERKPLERSRISGTVDPSETIRVTVLLRPRAPDRELSLVKRLGSQLPRDRSYPTRSEFENAFGSTGEELAKVRGFARDNSLSVLEASAAKRSVVLSGTVAQFSKLFNVSLSRYVHPEWGTYRGRTGPVYLPPELVPTVSAVLGLDNRPQARTHFRIRPAAAAGVSYTPPQVGSLYDFPSGEDGSGQTLGIIAVDPTSPYTGGAILGDRIRMQEHHADSGIYIRSMATRGSLGGLARTTADVATVLDASGRNLILIETVGVGQDEVEIVRVADVTVVILVPGMGDDVQTIKAGIMEIADIFVINKSDREGAENVEREIRAMQSLATRTDGWTPPVVKTVATTGAGVEDLMAAIAGYEAYLQKQNLVLKRSVQNWQGRLVEMLRDAMLEKARVALGDGQVERYAEEIAEHKRDPYTLVEEIVGKAGA